MLFLSVTPRIAQSYLDGTLKSSDERLGLIKQLESLPKTVGRWEHVESRELDASAAQMLQCYGYLNHEYWNKATGVRMNVAVLYGPRGPIAVHTPDICYSSRGVEPVGERKAEELKISEKPDSFWTIKFRQGKDAAPHIEVWYAWSDGGLWCSSENPRFWMTDSLWKIQVAAEPSAAPDQSECREFLKEFVPVLRACLRSKGSR